MDSSARVTSLDAVRHLRVSMIRFDADARDALTLLVLEVRRALEWLEQDRRRYWPEKTRRASDRVIETRNALERCQLKYGSEEAPPCYEQKMAFEKARIRLRFCEEKVKATKHWIRVVRHEVDQFDAQVAKMNNFLDGDLRRGVIGLDRMLRALEKYADGQAAPSPATARPRQASDDAAAAERDGSENL
jgi:hypothetical protein